MLLGGDEHSSVYLDFPIYGDGDDRELALKMSRCGTGIRSFEFRYRGYTVVRGEKDGELPSSFSGGANVSDSASDSGMNGKAGILPCTYSEEKEESKTLILELYDENSSIEIQLYYTVFRDFDAIARHAEIIHHGQKKQQQQHEAISIERLASWSIDLPPSPYEEGYSFLQLQGAWAREAHEVWTHIDQGKYVVSDMEGSKVHRANPFIAVTEGQVGEDFGIVRGFSFIYSGSFQSVLQVNQMGLLRINMGMHPDMFKWKLEPGESFTSPECVAVYSNCGLGGMSRNFHRLFRTRLARGFWRDRPRPILLNTWEPFQFDFTHDKLVNLAKSAQGTGVELFVLDDGWFGARNYSDAGLGDWYPNKEKLPKGLIGLADDINGLGLDFGIWVEPESVNEGSDLYRSHPEWAVEVPGVKAIQMRQQLLLDLANVEVQDYIIKVMTDLFSSSNISYQRLKHTREIVPSFVLKGLDSTKKYIVVELPHAKTEFTYGGDDLMTRGMIVPFSHDFEGHLYYVCEVEKNRNFHGDVD